MKLQEIVGEMLEEQLAPIYAQSLALKKYYQPQLGQKDNNYETGKGPIAYSDTAVNLIKKYESFENKTYLCPSGKKTIGYGTRIEYHPELKKNACITEKKATELLKKDLDTLVTPTIKKILKVKLKQNQLDALYSLIHNIGQNNFIGSKAMKYLNMGKFNKMKKEWGEFQMADGRVLPGLKKRRQEELSLFFKS